jgi:hypothetical protein
VELVLAVTSLSTHALLMEGKVFALAAVVLPILSTVFFAGGATMSGL